MGDRGVLWRLSLHRREVLQHILNGNYKGIGFDVIGLDPIADENLTRHKALFAEKDIVNIENLKNLGLCGTEPFWFACLPLKWKTATRACAGNCVV